MINIFRLSFFFFSSRRRHTSSYGDWSSYVCSSDLALDRRFCESCAKCGVVKPREFGKRRCAQVLARGKFCFAPLLRELVPRAHRKAIVAAIDAVADRLAKFVRDRSLAFDGEIGNAAPCIEPVGRGKR